MHCRGILGLTQVYFEGEIAEAIFQTQLLFNCFFESMCSSYSADRKKFGLSVLDNIRDFLNATLLNKLNKKCTLQGIPFLL